MSWLATALAGLLGLATPAAAHLLREQPAPAGPAHRPVQAKISSAATDAASSLLHDQPYAARPSAALVSTGSHGADPNAGGHAGATSATLSVPSGAQLLVHVPSGGLRAHRSPWASSPTVGTVAASSKYYHVPVTIWIERTNTKGTWGEVQLPYVWPRTDGWIPLHGLVRGTTSVVVTVDLSQHAVRVYRRGTLVFHVSAATGSSSSPTPPGDYVVTDRVPFGAGSALGSFAFGISGIQPRLPAGWSGGNQLAIHGTDEPWSIGQSVSAGCVRVSEWSLAHLEPLLRLGTPVLVRP